MRTAQNTSEQMTTDTSALAARLQWLEAQCSLQLETIQRQAQLIEAQAAVNTDQSDLLTDIQANYILIHRPSLAAALPKLLAAPAPAKAAFIRLLADVGPDGCTETAWTGLGIGREIGLDKATRDRLLGPLERTGIAQAAKSPGRGQRYSLSVVSNSTLCKRTSDLQLRSQSVLRTAATPDPFSITTLPERTSAPQLRTQSVLPPTTTLLERTSRPFVCLYESESDPDPLNKQTNSHPVTPTELQKIWPYLRQLGMKKHAQGKLAEHPAAHILACALQVKTGRYLHNPAGALLTMLAEGDEADGEYYDIAQLILDGKADGEDEARRLLKWGEANQAGDEPNDQADREQLEDPAGEFEENPADEPPAPEETHLDDPLPDHPRQWTPKLVWAAATSQLALQLSHATYDTWLRALKLIAYRDGALIVEARSETARNYIEKHLAHLVVEAVSKIAEQPIQVQFVAAPPLANRSAASGLR